MRAPPPVTGKLEELVPVTNLNVADTPLTRRAKVPTTGCPESGT